MNKYETWNKLKEPPPEIDGGITRWRINGTLHRIGGPAVIWADGTKFWYVNGIRHRVGGPAVEYLGGNRHWFHYGERHRIDGPAIIQANGQKFWYLHDREYALSDYNKKIKELNTTISV